MSDANMSLPENNDLETALVHALTSRGLTVSTVESCTGGMIAARLVNVPGASETFQEGFVTYSNKAKERAVGVRHETLEKYGAVSVKTCLEMALGGARTAGTDACISTTGIAGPGGGTPEKPVGLVYIGAVLGEQVEVRELRIKGDRLFVRTRSAEAAMRLLLGMLQ